MELLPASHEAKGKREQWCWEQLWHKPARLLLGPALGSAFFRDNTGREAPGHPLYLVTWVWSSPTALHSPGPAVGHSPACPRGSGWPGRVICGQPVPKELQVLGCPSRQVYSGTFKRVRQHYTPVALSSQEDRGGCQGSLFLPVLLAQRSRKKRGKKKTEKSASNTLKLRAP